MIEIQKTANENVLNFFPPKKIMPEGENEFVSEKSLRRSPLAETIFDIGGIESVFITPDMISITKKPDASWEGTKSMILAQIMDFIVTGEPLIIPEKQADNSDEILHQINALVEARIRPAIQKDGGDIMVEKFEKGVVFVTLSGKCSCCPYAMITLKEGVEKILRTYIPQVTEVRHTEKV